MNKRFVCNVSEAPRSSKARNEVFYLDQIREKYELEFDKLDAICLDGEIRPPYSYQWRATTKRREGEDDPFEGLGETPLKAIHELWKNVKYISEHQEELSEND